MSEFYYVLVYHKKEMDDIPIIYPPFQPHKEGYMYGASLSSRHVCKSRESPHEGKKRKSPYHPLFFSSHKKREK